MADRARGPVNPPMPAAPPGPAASPGFPAAPMPAAPTNHAAPPRRTRPDLAPAGETVAARLWRALRTAGVRAVYGDAGRGLPVTAPVPAALAPLLVAAHERVHRERAASWVDDVLTVGAGFPPPRRLRLDDAARIGELVAAATGTAPGGDAVAIRVDLDLARPAGGSAPPAAVPEPPSFSLDDVRARLAAAERPVVLAGPGVVTAGAVPALHAFATAGQAGVLNTWGAKGVFEWRSPHHWATIGLQRDDFGLAGLADADLIVAVGLDPDEAPAARWRLAPHVEVAPEALGTLAHTWRRPAGVAPMPPLRDRLARVTQPGWAVGAGPLPPSRVTRAYGEIAARGGLVAADPGVAGFWVARTVATTVPGSVLVPASRGRDGFAVAAALVARIACPARPVLAVLDALAAPGTAGTAGALRELSAALGLPVPVETWTPDGPAPDADAHGRRLADAVYGETPADLALRTDSRWLARMIDVAGPVIAWTDGSPQP